MNWLDDCIIYEMWLDTFADNYGRSKVHTTVKSEENAPRQMNLKMF